MFELVDCWCVVCYFCVVCWFVVLVLFYVVVRLLVLSCATSSFSCSFLSFWLIVFSLFVQNLTSVCFLWYRFSVLCSLVLLEFSCVMIVFS